VRDVYQFEMLGSCPDIDWNQRIALVSRAAPHLHRLGRRGDHPLADRPAEMRGAHVRKLTPEEIAALPPRAKPERGKRGAGTVADALLGLRKKAPARWRRPPWLEEKGAGTVAERPGEKRVATGQSADVSAAMALELFS